MIISETLSRINLNSTRIAKLLKSINDEIAEVTSAVRRLNQEKNDNRISQLQAENRDLEKLVEKYKLELTSLRINNGVYDVPLPQIPVASSPPAKEVSTGSEPINATENVLKDENVAAASKKEKTAKSQPNKTETKEANFGQLDIRVGQIVEVDKHPNADTLYVEKVNFGELNKTIVSGLVNHVPIEQMKNRLALFLVNLKPVKMRNVTSEGMIMCASDGDKVEILKPPEGSVPGDVVLVEGYEYKPEPVLNPKKKIFETLAPDLKVNDGKVATFKGVPWNVGGKGPATTQNLVNARIK